MWKVLDDPWHDVPWRLHTNCWYPSCMSAGVFSWTTICASKAQMTHTPRRSACSAPLHRCIPWPFQFANFLQIGHITLHPQNYKPPAFTSTCVNHTVLVQVFELQWKKIHRVMEEVWIGLVVRLGEHWNHKPCQESMRCKVDMKFPCIIHTRWSFQSLAVEPNTKHALNRSHHESSFF